MPDTTITALNTGAATASHVVAADNGAGTATHKIALGSIAGVGAPQAHAASHLPTGTDPINVLAEHIPTVISAGTTIADDLMSLEGTLVAITETVQRVVTDKAQTEVISWVPSIRLSNNTAPDGVTYTSSATAIRVGALVFLDGQITFSGYPGIIPAGAVWISGLPYAVETALHGVVFNAMSFVTANHLTTLYAPAALPRMKMQLRVPTAFVGGGGTADLTFGVLNALSSFRFQAFYKTNAAW